MRFALYSLLALVPSALALPAVESTVEGSLEVRAATGAAGVVASFKQLKADAITLNNTLNTFKPNDLLGLSTALQIRDQTAALSKDLASSIDVAKASKKFNQKQSGNIATAVLDFQPVVIGLLKNIVTKKPAFASGALLVGDLSQTVLKNLQDQSALTKKFSAAVTSKLSEPFKSLAPTVTKPINQAFTKAIKAYKSCSGAVCLPPIP